MRLLDAGQLDDPALLLRDSAVVRFVHDAAGAIRNVKTRMQLLDTGTHLFPVSVNDGAERPDNSYVVSPLTTYTGYADYELKQLGRPWLSRPMHWLVNLLSRRLEKARIDRVVQINNWLLSTNLYPPEWHGDNLGDITRLMREAYPDHAIGFRSLNRYSNPVLIDHLKALGYISIPSRQVYLFEARDGMHSAFLKHNNNRQDARLLSRTSYRLVPGHELDDSDYLRIEHLYKLLYLDKYCALNPQFSAEWLCRGQQDGWLQLSALRSPEDRIDGVVGWFSNDRIITSPVVGYDTALPRKLGLYRLLMQLSLEEAVRRRCLFNLSSGAAHFKRLRGGQPEIEYSMVYVRHLPRPRQRVWCELGQLLHAVGVPVMRKFKL